MTGDPSRDESAAARPETPAADGPGAGMRPDAAMTADGPWSLRLHPEPLRIARLAPGAAVPSWARNGNPLTSVTWNPHETSVLAPAHLVPVGVDQAGPFLAYEVTCPLDFTLVGVLYNLLAPLARHGVSVITMSTFDTDWVLVPAHQAEIAGRAWEEAGHQIVSDGQQPVAVIP